MSSFLWGKCGRLISTSPFPKVYKGVVAEYAELVAELCSGACIALEVRRKFADSGEEMMTCCGSRRNFSDLLLTTYLLPSFEDYGGRQRAC